MFLAANRYPFDYFFIFLRYEYQTAEKLENWYTNGIVSIYPGGGYMVDLSTTTIESEKIIENLRKSIWIDRGTRAIIIDFTVYNANINIFCSIKYIFTFIFLRVLSNRITLNFLYAD